ncbi:FecCD family ABC transporter permease [Phytohabitans kaempferiae]|uniref:FecCD family ABC transporter permease n=1 Tax=Phytohabitans kaempferiae TaxID=1620943 RepID=A0ABV6M6Z2_9ACTN
MATGALMVVAAAVGCYSLTVGEFTVPVREVIGVLAGNTSSDAHLVVMEWRLPRAILAIVVGACLGIGGAIFQSLSKNPLGSPDIVGFNVGAATGALVAVLVLDAGYYERAVGALIGGIIAGAAVYTLAYKRGIHGFRLVLVGIAVGSLLSSVNAYLIVKADLTRAMSAATWQAGSLYGLTEDHLWPVLITFLVLLPVALALSRPMRILEMGDDTARSLGVSHERVRLALVGCALAMTAAATAIAGPIAFVALAAPQLARRVARTPGIAVLPSAAMGAVLLSVSDLLARRLFAPAEVPVGAVTICLGGGYLVWLLARERHRGRS